MTERVVSVFPVNVTPTDDDPATFKYRCVCSCGRRSRPIWTDRAKAEAFGREHLEFVGALNTPLSASERANLGRKG